MNEETKINFDYIMVCPICELIKEYSYEVFCADCMKLVEPEREDE